MNKEEFPPISKAIVDALDDLVPKRFPGLEDTDREIWYNAGRASVVDLLIHIYEIQNDDYICA